MSRQCLCDILGHSLIADIWSERPSPRNQFVGLIEMIWTLIKLMISSKFVPNLADSRRAITWLFAIRWSSIWVMIWFVYLSVSSNAAAKSYRYWKKGQDPCWPCPGDTLCLLWHIEFCELSSFKWHIDNEPLYVENKSNDWIFAHCCNRTLTSAYRN